MSADTGRAVTTSVGDGRVVGGGVAGSLEWGLCSDRGPNREQNEDHAVSLVGSDGTRLPLFVVCDGLGGHASGEVASLAASAEMLRWWETERLDDPVKAIRGGVRSANGAVVAESSQPGRAGMATTLTALTLLGAEAVIAHVGDSRAYLIRNDSCLQLTSDHSRVGEMLRMKLLTPEQAAQHPARSQLTRSLGTAPSIQVDIVRQELLAGDVFVLCSDGLWGELAQRDFVSTVTGIGASLADARAAAVGLVDVAVGRNAGDNVTAVVVRVNEVDGSAAPAERRSFLRRRRS